MDNQRGSVILLMLCLLVRDSTGAYIGDPSKCTIFPCVIFDDQFNFLDHDAWAHEITMAGGYQLVSDWRNESFVTDGTNDIWGLTGRNEVCTGPTNSGCFKVAGGDTIINPVMSGRIRTLGNFSFKYGKVEARAKLPSGDWLWPAIWLQPDSSPYGPWPASGEIDVLESRGNEVYGDFGNAFAGCTLHWGPYEALNRYPWTHVDYSLTDGTTFVDDFHTWTFEWNSSNISFSLDGELLMFVDPITNFFDFGNFSQEVDIDNPWVAGQKMAPFDQKFYILINLAIGSTLGYFPDDVPSDPPKPWENETPSAMKDFWDGRDLWLPTWQHGEGKISEKAALQVDYVTVYKMAADD